MNSFRRFSRMCDVHGITAAMRSTLRLSPACESKMPRAQKRGARRSYCASSDGLARQLVDRRRLFDKQLHMRERNGDLRGVERLFALLEILKHDHPLEPFVHDPEAQQQVHTAIAA